MPTVGSCFSGIGGIELGFERAGWTCSWQVEVDEFARRVLAKHWPDVPRHVNIRDVGIRNLERVDCIVGGVPCQGFSLAGRRRGLDDHRSGLWWEYHRIILELQPRIVVLENVPGLLGNGLSDIIRAFAEIGYVGEWEVVGAASLGAPHLRERVFVVAHSDGDGVRQQSERHQRDRRSERETQREHGIALDHGAHGQLADTGSEVGRESRNAVAADGRVEVSCGAPEPGRCGGALADADGERLALGTCFGGDAREELEALARGHREAGGVWERLAQSGVGGASDGFPAWLDGPGTGADGREEVVEGAGGQVLVEPWERGVHRSVTRARGRRHGDMLRIATLGNAVVPQVAELVGRRVMQLWESLR